jgi:dephospho-CoA kinase
MITVGLTGGIATGKSSVAAILREELSLPVIDADQVSRDITARGTPGLAWVVEAFGEDVLNTDGSLDRRALGSLVMSQPHRRKQLEGITHPLIREEIQARLTALERGGAAVAVVEAALLVETGSHEHYDRLLVVTCSPDVQRARLMSRNQYSAEEAERWVEAQMPLEQKEAMATAVIRNDGDLEQLREATLVAWDGLEF